MNTSSPFGFASVPSYLQEGKGWLRLVCTNNPFYVLSAGLFLAGLWVSFGAQSENVQTWALMSGLAGYTLLLAVTACLLVRFGNVWDDVRTVLLLVVLMFLATSVTFDEVLVFDPVRGFICYALGFCFAITVSEGIFRGCRLSMPLLFRAPYYSILALFFLYPLALRPLLSDPHDEALVWGLFGFCTVAGIVFLTLLPAIWRGPDYVRDNGSPWRWPLYPWVLFGLLGGAVPARAFLLCWSMQLLQNADLTRVLFGPFFVAPFGLAVAVLLLEIGLVSRSRAVPRTALAVPIIFLSLTVFAHRDDPIYRNFLAVFTTRIGEPLAIQLLASAAFYSYAAMRGATGAIETLTATLAALALVGPETLNERELTAPQAIPLLAAAALQLGFGLGRRNTWRCLLGTGLMVVAALALPEDGDLLTGGVVAFHLALLGMLVIGALFDDPLAHVLRVCGVTLVALAGLAALSSRFSFVEDFPPWLLSAYPLLMVVVLAGYGKWLDMRSSFVAAALVLTGWLGVAGWRGYCWLRQIVAGLDHMLLGLALFGLAFLVSVAKSGTFTRWLRGRQVRVARRAAGERPA